MPHNTEYIEQLVLEKLAGVISPEDSATLKKMIEEDPAARAIWDDFSQQLDNPDMSAAREEFLNTHTAEQLVSGIKKRKQRYIYRATGLGIAASLLIMLVTTQVRQPENVKQSPVSLHFTQKNVALKLPGFPLMELGSEKQQKIAFGDAIFYQQSDQLFWTTGPRASRQPATILVPRGRKYTATLPDGSTIILNEESTLEFLIAFNGPTREVTISGEAYLKIMPDPQRPFLVHVPHGTVHVLGTEFNVNTRDSKKVKIALATGAIKVVTAADTLTLRPRQIVNYEEGKPLHPENLNNQDPFYWKDTYPFQNTRVHDISLKLVQLYQINVSIDDTAASNLTFTTVLDHHKPLKAFLDELKGRTSLFDYSFKKEGKDSVLHIKYVH
ncbi:FecR family protein [Chitinophaga sp. CF118]|uniref:FecR family protein n=1 Tax=Chitinophaga sp. CF118 TaxID=1884367 RepID=UPI0008E4BC3C|nr:FecR family protein [Chitinophaga sp. CF118]SFD20535.1 FecR family protein [Chitinophaga sp. CF118]